LVGLCFRVVAERRRLVNLHGANCSCRQGYGSFVKVELLDLGTDVVSALADRYCDTETALTGGAIKSGAGRAIPIMLVGDVKIRCVRWPSRQSRIRASGAIA
jgi:hypothetical protein